MDIIHLVVDHLVLIKAYDLYYKEGCSKNCIPSKYLGTFIWLSIAHATSNVYLFFLSTVLFYCGVYEEYC